jgi:hypothetical protein
MNTYGGVQVQLRAFLTSALDGGEWSASLPGHFALKERTLVPTEQEAGGRGTAGKAEPVLMLWRREKS